MWHRSRGRQLFSILTQFPSKTWRGTDQGFQKPSNLFPTPPQRKERGAAGGRPPPHPLSFFAGAGGAVLLKPVTLLKDPGARGVLFATPLPPGLTLHNRNEIY